jgi:hypothetical protein
MNKTGRAVNYPNQADCVSVALPRWVAVQTFKPRGYNRIALRRYLAARHERLLPSASFGR